MEYRQAHLHAVSERSEDVAALLHGTYDLLLCSPSWDARCICITHAKEITAARGVVLKFHNQGEQGLRAIHDSQLLQFVECCCEQMHVIESESENLDRTWDALRASIMDAAEWSGRRLRVLIDMSACPRYYALGALALCLEAGVAESIDVFHAEGIYPGQADEAARHEMFTIGRWETVAVPLVEGWYDPGKGRFYFVSVGFEGSKTMRAVSRADPDRVSILFPKPGVVEAYEVVTYENNQALLETYQSPQQQIVNAPAGDAVAAWKAMDAARLERPDEENTYYVCCGTKAHSLAFALRALALEYPTLLYNKPDEHKEIAIRPSGVFWNVTVRDVSRS